MKLSEGCKEALPWFSTQYPSFLLPLIYLGHDPHHLFVYMDVSLLSSPLITPIYLEYRRHQVNTATSLEFAEAKTRALKPCPSC
jgi:hypothetical protein